MNYLSLIDAERLAFARLASEAARRTGGRQVTNIEMIHCSDGLALLCADIGGESATQGLELPASAWNPALEAHIKRLFLGSAQLAVQQMRAA